MTAPESPSVLRPLKPHQADDWLDFAGRRAFADIVRASTSAPREYHGIYISVVAKTLAAWRQGALAKSEWLLLLARMLADCGVPRDARRQLLVGEAPRS